MSVFRNLLMAKAMKSKIPTDVDSYIYDYAEGFGNSYSRIDYIPVYGDKIEYEFEPTGGGDNFNFGTRVNVSSNGYTLISNYSMGFVGYGGATTNTTPISSTLNEIHTVKMSKDGIFLDDVEVAYTSLEQDGIYNMVIGAVCISEVTIDTRSALTKHRSFTVHSEDDVLKHRILAVVKDGVCQLYDNVTDTYYPSLADEYGTGERVGYVKDGIAYNMDGSEMFPTTVTDEYVFTSADDYDEPWIPNEYYLLSSWQVGKPYTGEPTVNSMSVFAIFELEFSVDDTISIYGLGGSGGSRLYGVANTDTNIITKVAASGENTIEEPFTFTPDYNGVIYTCIMSANGGKIIHTHK